MQAVRSSQYKYIHYYGVWDTDELYDIVADPLETRNLYPDPAYQQTVAAMNEQLFDILEQTGGLTIQLRRDRGKPRNLRPADAARPADFPRHMLQTPVRR